MKNMKGRPGLVARSFLFHDAGGSPECGCWMPWELTIKVLLSSLEIRVIGFFVLDSFMNFLFFMVSGFSMQWVVVALPCAHCAFARARVLLPQEQQHLPQEDQILRWLWPSCRQNPDEAPNLSTPRAGCVRSCRDEWA